jgi:hypothetical protein
MSSDINDTTEVVLNSVIKLKRGTEGRWNETNPILAQGEPGFVSDMNKLKVGDGITSWNDLPYIATGSDSSGGGVVVYETFEKLPEAGENNLIYKVDST